LDFHVSGVPQLLANRLTDGGKAVDLPPAQEDYWNSFLLDAEHIPGPSTAGRTTSIEEMPCAIFRLGAQSPILILTERNSFDSPWPLT
jgi:hypothetical protein